MITVHRNIILPVVSYGHETWPLTLRKEHRLRVSENSVLRNIFRLKRDEAVGGEDYLTRSFMICTPNQLLFR
jgi:hypothetical protein